MGKVFKIIGILTVAFIGLIVVIAVAGGGGGGDTTTAPAPAAGGAEPAQKERATAKLGQAVKDGDFTFTVNSVKAGPSRIGDQYLNETPNGKYMLVAVTVTNHGSEPSFFSGDDQYLFDSAGRKAGMDTEATIMLDADNAIFEEINPGVTLTATLVFDVPKDAAPAKVELHDSAFSGGVTVPVSASKA